MEDSPTQSHVLQLAHTYPNCPHRNHRIGNRGLLTLQRYLQIEGTEIKALSEIREGNTQSPTHTQRSKAPRSHGIYRTRRLAKMWNATIWI